MEMNHDNTRHTLEMCAKALGRRIISWERGVAMLMTGNPMLSEPFNPLADTDAGRSQCAVMCSELGISTDWNNHPYDAYIRCYTYRTHHNENYSDHSTKTAAWQAAACAVAAQIAEGM
jgi:hypothetical protein